MYKCFVLCCFALLSAFSGRCQDEEDNNVVIKNASEEYKFVKGNATYPVQVKQKLSTTYLCNNYRTNIPVLEFYNDLLEMNDADAKIDGDKVKNFKPAQDYYSSDGIFYSDARVCYFTLPLEKKGSESDVSFEKTALDPRYFTSIFFTETYPVQKKEVSIVVPKWMKLEIKEFNFKGYTISKEVKSKDDADVYTYTLLNAPALKNETQAPGPTFIAPHLLIMCKYAEPNGTRITYFNTLADQYAWYRQLVKQIGNDQQVIKAKAEEITKGINGDVEKVKALYQWVQDNIRYIAFEDGIAGFKPEKAQEVLRKKYGDCKGMGNLMAELLKGIGLDGRLCWLGTHHIAYNYSTPSLAVDNHMICAWLYKGKTYFLDATEKYIGFGETAERIQGRQVLIEDGEKYLLQTIPSADPQQNIAIEKRTLSIEGNNLTGRVVQTWKGESKEWMLNQLHETKKEKQEEALKRFLSEGNANYQISNLKILNLNDYNSELKIEYDLVFKDAVSSFDKEMYLDVDNRKDFNQLTFDVKKRKLPFRFYFKNHLVFETEIALPPGTRPEALPAVLKVDQPEYSLQGGWTAAQNKIVYRREILLKNTEVLPQQFDRWNADMKKLEEFYNNQITITK